MYVERPSVLRSCVVWRRRADSAARVVPDGCTDLIWSGTELLVAGPDTCAHIAPAAPGQTLVGVRFGPAVGPAVLAIAVDELRDQRVEFAALASSADARHAEERLADAADPAAELEALVGERMGPPSPTMLGVAALLDHGWAVGEVAGEVGLSARQLQRRSVEAFGYGPKLLARILRFQRATRLARSGTPFAAIAADAGFSDQAHLAREVKDLAGVTLGELIA